MDASRGRDSGQRPVLFSVLAIAGLAAVVCLFSSGFDQRAQGTDFPEFYAAARQVAEGDGGALYDFRVQDAYQARLAGRAGTYYNHPPFETLLFLPFCLGSLHTAYLSWCIFNALLLALTARLFEQFLFDRYPWQVWLLGFFLFPPVLLNFLQGQDSILLLLDMTLVLAALKKQRHLLAGLVLGLGLFKFHIVVGFGLLVLASYRKLRFAAGFALTSVVLFLVSAAVAGWGFLSSYAHFLGKLSSLPLAGIHPSQMANLRGLVAASGLAGGAKGQLIAAAVLSVLLVIFTVVLSRRPATKTSGTRTPALGCFIAVALLTGYHLSPHDLAIALIPLALAWRCLSAPGAQRNWTWYAAAGCLLVFTLPPWHVLLLAVHHYAFASLPLIALLLLQFAAPQHKIA